jgi:hypothetical protein
VTTAEFDALWALVKDLEPLTAEQVEHYTRVSFRTSPSQARGWVREYVPRIVRTLLGEYQALGEAWKGPGAGIGGRR